MHSPSLGEERGKELDAVASRPKSLHVRQSVAHCASNPKKDSDSPALQGEVQTGILTHSHEASLWKDLSAVS